MLWSRTQNTLAREGIEGSAGMKTIKGNQSGRGGARSGAGRKKGSLGQRTRLIAEAAIVVGDAPLNVLLSVMRKAYADGDLPLALDAAKAAAPFCHPRLAAIEHTGKDGGAIETRDVTARDRIAGKIARMSPKGGSSRDNSQPV